MGIANTTIELLNHPAPGIAKGMKQVTKAVFFAKMNPLNVHPGGLGRYHQILGYTTEWKMPNGAVIGVSDGGTVFLEGRYYLP